MNTLIMRVDKEHIDFSKANMPHNELRCFFSFSEELFKHDSKRKGYFRLRS